MFWNFVLFAVSTLITFALTPTPEAPEAAGEGDIEIPHAREGSGILVVMGSVDIRGPVVIGQYDFQVEPIIEKQSLF